MRIFPYLYHQFVIFVRRGDEGVEMTQQPPSRSISRTCPQWRTRVHTSMWTGSNPLLWRLKGEVNSDSWDGGQYLRSKILLLGTGYGHCSKILFFVCDIYGLSSTVAINLSPLFLIKQLREKGKDRAIVSLCLHPGKAEDTSPMWTVPILDKVVYNAKRQIGLVSTVCKK
jgi:hypothetical protein